MESFLPSSLQQGFVVTAGGAGRRLHSFHSRTQSGAHCAICSTLDSGGRETARAEQDPRYGR